MNILNEFDLNPNFQKLGRRGKNFRAMIEHVLKYSGSLIVETGTAWDKNNWEGQGQSTLIWDWLLSRCEDLSLPISIDVREEGISVAKGQTQNVRFICGDAVKVLGELAEPGKIHLLYLDSYDWTPETNIESAAHHLMELTSIWPKLPLGCMVVVDDRHGEFQGKHWMVEAFMKKVSAQVAFKNHQIGWIKTF